MTRIPDPGSASLLRHAVMVGLTPLIPVPFLDDVVRDTLRRRMVRGLAAEERVALGEAAVDALAVDPTPGFLAGCLPMLVVYPLRKLFRKVFFFLEVKRSIDLVSTTWHYGWLLQLAMADGKLAGDDPARARAVRATVETLVAESAVTPLERAFREVLRHSGAVLRGGADLLAGALRGVGRRRDRVEQAVADVAPLEDAQIEGVVARLQAALRAVPAEHLDRLAAELLRRLSVTTGEPAP